ncbi:MULTISPECIES: GumC family protein [unclassified Coleofasciculus]|uniref:GumC family protein n=1 Tax=unclassified Coleofasciculus TaxID=2692782 RepID=UPI00187EEBB6|nr:MULTISPECIES: polysaccharide biosynthesis tyrosine autokinase [unclassified Coleofasciculus]MBE9125344.1 polysaccharide biosynthesis tyrosine autokinase [Coleofasciculus sp. LEGE 07081]MBE9148547.1 polysaccharide biosynthesis tyrosine autokinase [Coleofasciculus sp. LEGE 07092]
MESPQSQYIEEIDFQKYWLVLKRRWLAVVGGVGVGVVLAGLVVSREVPVYKAGGTLLFKMDRSDSLTGLTNDLGEFDKLAQKSDPIVTEAEVIQSRPLAEKTVAALNLRDEEGNPLPPEKILGGLDVKPLPGTDVMQISYKSTDPELAAAVVNKLIDVYLANDILINRAKATAAREFISKQLPLVKENVTRADAELRQFKEQNKVVDLQQEAQQTVEVASSLEQNIAQTQARLADSAARSEALRDQVGLNSEAAVALSSLSQSAGVQQVLTELQKVQTQLAVERSRFQEEAPTIKNLREQEERLKSLLEERIAPTLGSQQQVPTDNLQIGKIREDLAEKFVSSEVDRSGLEQQLRVLRKTLTAYKQRSTVLPRLEESQKELERRVTAAQSTYELLLQKLEEARLVENQNVGNVRVISEAVVPKKPAASKKKLILAAGGVAGFLLGIAAAFLLDLIDTSVKTVKEAKELFGYTLLGVIPAFGKSGSRRFPFRDSEPTLPRLVTRDLPRSSMAQAYQMLRANLKFLSSDKQIKAIVVTSSVPQEGKSEVCANLAIAMAQVGRRVLLVDADMRYPSQHHFWNLTNALGLSNLLVGETEFNRAVQEVMPGLDVLTSGIIPPNPVAILDSKRMATLMETFSKDYDAVIVDTPPLAGVADAPILGNMADGILLVVRPGVVDSASAKAGKDFLTRSSQNVLGLIANGVIVKNEPDSYFYYTKDNYYTKSDSVKPESAKAASSGSKSG